MKKGWICFLLACHLGMAYGQKNVIDEIVWVVGDEAILLSDVEFQRLYMQNEGQRFDGDPYCIIPEQIAIQKLYLNQAKTDSVDVSESQVIRAVDQWITWAINQSGSKEKLVNLSSDEKESVVKNEKEVETFYVPSIPPVFSGYNKRYIRHAWFLIRQFIRIEKNDRLIFHLNYYQEYSLIPCIREAYPDSRIFFTVHFQEWCFQVFGNTTYYKEILHRNKETLKTDKERMVYDLYEKEQMLFKETDKIICLARYTYTLLREEYGIPEEKLVLIYNGLKDEYIPISPEERLSIRRKLFFRDNEKIILFAGRLDEIKGIT